jgi:hypothetical protein
MRSLAFDHLQKVYGKMSPENLPILQKHMKRLTNLWKKDPSRFYSEVEPQETNEAVEQTAKVCHLQRLMKRQASTQALPIFF